MSTIALAPLMCYSHPNGLQSLLKYPNIICGSGEHGGMLAFGISLLVVGVLGFLALCTFAAFQVPHWSARELHHRVRCFRFLVFRFRLDSWWFGVPLLCRGPLISLPIVLFTDYQSIQSILVTTILCAFLVIQGLAWPWKARKHLMVHVRKQCKHVVMEEPVSERSATEVVDAQGEMCLRRVVD